MKKIAKFASIILAVVLLVSLLGGCANNQPSDVDEPDVTKQVVERAYPYTFTDMAGVEITLDKEVESVYIVGNVQPLVALYRYYAGNSDKLIECPAASQSIIRSSVLLISGLICWTSQLIMMMQMLKKFWLSILMLCL